MEKIKGSRCPRCKWIVVPPKRICPKHPVEMEPVEVSGHGSVMSYTTLTSTPEGFKAPLQMALVELAEGGRILCHGKQERDLKIGRRVAIEQVDGIFYFAHLNVADRVALFWRRGATDRARSTNLVKGTAARIAALFKVFKPSAKLEKPAEHGNTGIVTNMTKSITELPIIERARRHAARTAITDSKGTFTYEELLDASARIASALLGETADLNGKPVPFLITPGFPWVAVQWGIWRAGGIAVPLPLGSPAAELEYFIDDTKAEQVIADAAGQKLLAPITGARGIKLLDYEDVAATEPAQMPEVAAERSAMILYTSGTTNRPKGVVTTHDNIAAQITSLVHAWEWTTDDQILLCLPLHHVHGIVNVVSCALWSGATCDMLPRFDVNTVWDRIVGGNLTLFMAVPTIYSKLISARESSSEQRRADFREGCQRLRLMVSGSAALPVGTLNRWRDISGHTLLERYGMTEIGMALSNPLKGERVPGSVGAPLPGVEVQLVDERGETVSAGMPGEIEVRGPTVFKEYWGKPQATQKAFRDGWFRTGDVAVVENGRYRILGRQSVDIIKSGGHKISALEVEEQLREHPAIAECAVVGVPDPEWGERVAAAVVVHEGKALELEQLRNWSRERLAPYKIPSLLALVQTLPRNAMGKVTKPAVVKLFTSSRDQAGVSAHTELAS